MRSTGVARDWSSHISAEVSLALSPLGERVARAGALFSRRGTGEGVESRVPVSFRITNGWLRAKGRA
jgi:hypothetical protein